jgi:hypothetical protein
MIHPPTERPVLVPDVEMTVTFYSERKHFAFAARHDTGASCYISPMLAEQVGLDRDDAGRVLVGTLATNTVFLCYSDPTASRRLSILAVVSQRGAGPSRGDGRPAGSGPSTSACRRGRRAEAAWGTRCRSASPVPIPGSRGRTGLWAGRAGASGSRPASSGFP